MALRSVVVHKSGLVSDHEDPSLRRLLSHTLASLPPSVHQNSHLTALHQTLMVELSSLHPRLSGYASGLSLLPDVSDLTRSPGVPQFDHIADCLELFDSFLLGQWANDEEQSPLYHDVINGVGQDDLAERLAILCAVCNIIFRHGDYQDNIPIGETFDKYILFVWLTLSCLANRCLESTLRVLINLSHENPTWCQLLLYQEFTIPAISSLIASFLHGANDTAQETGERDAQAFDRLCLALGLLTNLVQVDKNSQDLCRETSETPCCSSSASDLNFCRTRSVMSSPPPVRIRMQMSERRQRSRVPCFGLRESSPARGRRSWDPHRSRAPRSTVWPPHAWLICQPRCHLGCVTRRWPQGTDTTR